MQVIVRLSRSSVIAVQPVFMEWAGSVASSAVAALCFVSVRVSWLTALSPDIAFMNAGGPQTYISTSLPSAAVNGTTRLMRSLLM